MYIEGNGLLSTVGWRLIHIILWLILVSYTSYLDRYKDINQNSNCSLLQGRSQDLAGRGGQEFFLQIWKFLCRKADFMGGGASLPLPLLNTPMY